MSHFNEVYGDPNLSAKAKLVLLYLHDRANQSGESWYAINTMAKDLSLSRSTVKRALGELYRAGLLTKEPRRRPNGGLTSNLYRLTRAEQSGLPQNRGRPLCRTGKFSEL